MLLSIILLNVRNVERHKSYLDATLSVLDRQITFRCENEDVEILMVSDESYKVDSNMFPVVSKLIKYVPSNDFINGVRNAVKISSGTHITFIDNYSGFKYVGAINNIVDTIKQCGDKNIVFPVDTQTVHNDTSYRYLTGKVILADTIREIVENPKFRTSRSPSFYLANSIDNRTEFGSITPINDLFIRYAKLSVTENTVKSINDSLIENSYDLLYSLNDRYVTEILNTLYEIWSNCNQCGIDLTTTLSMARRYCVGAPALTAMHSLKFLANGPEKFKQFIELLEEEING